MTWAVQFGLQTQFMSLYTAWTIRERSEYVKMTDMELNTQEQALGTPDQSNWFQVILEDTNCASCVINASLMAPSRIA